VKEKQAYFLQQGWTRLAEMTESEKRSRMKTAFTKT